MELDQTAAATICAIGALLGYQYGTRVRQAARRAYAYCRAGQRG
jgi:hypothetical protein